MLALLSNFKRFLLGGFAPLGRKNSQDARWYMYKLLFPLSVFAALFSSAEMRTVTGYGTGDNLEQAIVAAKVDAVLNAGGRTSVLSEAKQDQLIKDEGKSENEACLVSYEVVEKGDSFAGPYVRIKAKVSKNGEFTLKDGRTEIIGEAVAANERDARVLAMCNAILESGSRIKAVVKYENEQLVADDALINAHGVVVSSITDKAGANAAKVRCQIYPDVGSLTELFPKKLIGVGEGMNAAVAESAARRDMVLSWGSEFFIRSAYKGGELRSFAAERKCDAYISANRVGGSVESPVGQVKMEGMRFLDGKGLELVECKQSEGVGCGADVAAAHNAAFCDAFVNLGSHVTMVASYDKERQTMEEMTYRSAYNYFGEDIVIMRLAGGEYLVKSTIRAGGNLPEVDAGIEQSVEVVGLGKGKMSAIKDAKQRAIDMVFGCPVDVRVRESNGVVVDAAYSAKHSPKGYVDRYELLAEDNSTGATTVTIRAVVKNHDGDPNGWDWITATIIIVILCGVFVGVKKKMGVVALTVVWILAAVALFATGHWVVGIAAILSGLGATQDEE